MSLHPPTIAETIAAGPQPSQKKRRPNWKALLFVVVFFGGVLVAGYLQSPLSTVSSIEVKGLREVRYEEVLRAADIRQGMSFWRIKKSDAAANIMAANPLIESADLTISWKGEVVIAVVEKTAAGLLLADDGFHPVLQDGTVLAKVEQLEGTNVPIISLDTAPTVEAGQRLDHPDLLELTKQMPEVDRAVLDQISEIRVTVTGQWRLFMRDKFEVRIPPRQFADKMKTYSTFRTALGSDKPPGILDLESDYYKPFTPGQKKGGE
ncbi:FtsQ-type POTRA domain-containing protein [Tumebacillus sp. DT12]|uniref:FtsQ-type POTRA domain-containing protein n=1 Tax=Tumebacillus lacus TaxID=2995335 RepID=A0ABT3X3Y9_9BACL|nr:FtsQ-type POTRA domain-containing protein [Tumebacillus lacus]MCX7571610.1 FtsQ-type POTRA domain-containing protein [Tumebacillus lacus]